MIEHVSVKIVRLSPDMQDIPFPAYATEGAAGMDVCAALEKELVVAPQETVLVPTGFSIELPVGFEAQVRPRSGLAIKHSIGILNSPGTIDSDYRGEVKIILTNFGKTSYTIQRGDRIAQMIIGRYSRVEWKEVPTLAGSMRGEGGFGHSGIASREIL